MKAVVSSPYDQRHRPRRVSAWWATQNQLVLGQTKVADYSNEITAIPELLQLLEIAGCIVRVDAIGTQTEIAEPIFDGGGDYLLAVKENQGHLFEVDVVQEFMYAQHSHAKTVNKGHGRIETRECWATEKEEYLSGAQALAMERTQEHCSNCFATTNW